MKKKTIIFLSKNINNIESLAHEMELERKTRQSGDRDVKSPLQERPNYYKNSVLFSSAT